MYIVTFKQEKTYPMNFRKTLRFLALYWFPPALFALFIFYLSTIPDLKSAFPAQIDFVLRKLAHMSEFFILTILFARIQLHGRKKEIHARVLAGAGILALAAAFLDEFLIQRLTPGRHGALEDVTIDMVGILGAIVFLSVFHGRDKETRIVIKK